MDGSKSVYRKIRGVNRRLGFSLVELSLAIAVCSVLAGLLFLAGAWGLRASKAATCASHLRQAHHSLSLYAADHDDTYPPYYWLGVPTRLPRPPFDHEVAFHRAMGAYGWVRQVRYCPLDALARTTAGSEWTSHLHSSYHLSPEVFLLGLAAKGPTWFFRPSRVHDSAATPLIHDATWLERGKDGRENRRSSHGDRVNIVYLDGHTKLSVLDAP